ncbi:MAG: hypothetical protein GY793_10260 [Proteobacteria bacterium]|nr:hypothetical protein [Pseudomonadota bacterium]
MYQIKRITQYSKIDRKTRTTINFGVLDQMNDFFVGQDKIVGDDKEIFIHSLEWDSEKTEVLILYKIVEKKVSIDKSVKMLNDVMGKFEMFDSKNQQSDFSKNLNNAIFESVKSNKSVDTIKESLELFSIDIDGRAWVVTDVVWHSSKGFYLVNLSRRDSQTVVFEVMPHGVTCLHYLDPALNISEETILFMASEIYEKIKGPEVSKEEAKLMVEGALDEEKKIDFEMDKSESQIDKELDEEVALLRAKEGDR